MTARKLLDIGFSDGSRATVTEERAPEGTYGVPFRTDFYLAFKRMILHTRSLITAQVAACLPERLSYTVFKKLKQLELAKELKTTEGSVSRALAELLKLGYVEKRGSGAHIEWRLNNDGGWDEKVGRWHRMRRAQGKPPLPANALPPPASDCRIRDIMESRGRYSSERNIGAKASASARSPAKFG